MSIFDRIKHAIFGEAHAQQPAQSAPASTPAAGAPSPSASNAATAAPSTSPAPVAPSAPTAAAQPGTGPRGSAAASTASSNVDIAPILDAAVRKSGQKLDWKHSIVDLMKALGMDASLEERKELAGELGYDGDVHDSSKMNIFLHKALMKKLSENGGKVPADLLD